MPPVAPAAGVARRYRSPLPVPVPLAILPFPRAVATTFIHAATHSRATQPPAPRTPRPRLASAPAPCDTAGMSERFRSCFDVAQPIIGMLHLLPLPGAPGFAGDIDAVRDRLLADLHALVEGGVHGVMIENFGDAPFHPRRVPAQTIAHVTALAARVRNATDLPIGINVLRNDGCAALAVAHAVDAQFIRVNILCGARVTDQGLMQGIAHRLIRRRAQLHAHDIAILADVNVKHSAPLAPIPLDQEVHDLIHRGHADALIFSGTGTGTAADLAELQAVKHAADPTAVLLGSGVSADNLPDYRPHADGFIVGSSLKTDGLAASPVDPARVRALLAAAGR